MTNVMLQPEQVLAALTAGRLVLVPNQRTRETLLQQWQASQQAKVWRWPRVEAIDFWLRDQWQRLADGGISPYCELKLLEPAEEFLLWLQVVQESLATTPLLNPAETATSLSRTYHSSRQWLLDEQQPGLSAYRGITEVGAFLTWSDRFRQRCRQEQLVTLVDLIHLLLQSPQHLQQTEPPVLVNFFSPPPLYTRLLQTLTGIGGMQTAEFNLLPEPKLPLRLEFADPQSEIRACAAWANELVTTSPSARVVLICPEGNQHIACLSRAFDELRPPSQRFDLNARHRGVNVLAGSTETLNRTGVIRCALLLLDLGADSMGAEDFCQLLTSPFLAGTESESAARLQLQLRLRRQGDARLQLARVMNEMNRSDRGWHCPLLASQMLAARNLLRSNPPQQTAAAWIAVMRQWLELFGWPGAELAAVDVDAVSAWEHLLERVASTAVLPRQLGAMDVLAGLRTLCSNTQLPVAQDPACPVTFCSPDQAVGMSMTHAWLLGMDDAVWPAAATPDPFLPFALQRDLGMPGCSAQQRLLESDAILALLQRGPTVQLLCSHSRRVEDQERRAAARFADLPVQPSVLAPRLPAPAPPPDPSRFEQHADAGSLPLSGSFTGDSALPGHQSACPFRAFARYRLQVQPLEDFTPGLNRAARGAALHRALEHFWNATGSAAALAALGEAELGQRIGSAVDAALALLRAQHAVVMTPAFSQLEKERLSRLLLDFLQLERRREAFTVLHTEESLHWRHQDLCLNLKADRIDRLGDNSLALLDYKSGRQMPNPARWLDAQPEDLQLPVYLLAARQRFAVPVSALALAQVNVEATGFSGYWHPESLLPGRPTLQPDPDWPALQQRWQDYLQLTAEAFLAGHHQVAPARGALTCQRCGLQALCRITELDQDDLIEDAASP